MSILGDVAKAVVGSVPGGNLITGAVSSIFGGGSSNELSGKERILKSTTEAQRLAWAQANPTLGAAQTLLGVKTAPPSSPSSAAAGAATTVTNALLAPVAGAGALLGGLGGLMSGAATAGSTMADQILSTVSGPGGIGMAALVAGGTGASAGTMQSLVQVGSILWDAAKKVVNWVLGQMQALQSQIASAGMAAWALIKQLEGQIWSMLKSILPYAGIAAVVAAIGLGIFFGWDTMKRWAKTLWNKLTGKKKTRRRGISARDLSTTRRTINKLKTMKKAVKLAKSF